MCADVRLASESALRIVWLHPDLLSTYGDRGNALVLARRARARGLRVESVEVRSGRKVPEQGDIYLIGGGEDGPQARAARLLYRDGGLRRAAESGAVIFGVCAGYQLLGESFMTEEGRCAGLGLLDVDSDRAPVRAVGELAGRVDPALALPPLTGFENHNGRTQLGPRAVPLAEVAVGVGNDGATEGAVMDKVVGTYCHGPALARNPALGDLLLRWATGSDRLEPLDETWSDRLRSERLAAVGQD